MSDVAHLAIELSCSASMSAYLQSGYYTCSITCRDDCVKKRWAVLTDQALIFSRTEKSSRKKAWNFHHRCTVQPDTAVEQRTCRVLHSRYMVLSLSYKHSKQALVRAVPLCISCFSAFPHSLTCSGRFLAHMPQTRAHVFALLATCSQVYLFILQQHASYNTLCRVCLLYTSPSPRD